MSPWLFFAIPFHCSSAFLSHALKEPQEFCRVCFINLLNLTTPMNITGVIFYGSYFIVLIWMFYLLTSIFQEYLWTGHLCSCVVSQWLQWRLKQAECHHGSGTGALWKGTRIIGRIIGRFWGLECADWEIPYLLSGIWDVQLSHILIRKIL